MSNLTRTDPNNGRGESPSQTPRDWGKICIITRLEKMVENQFVEVWTNLITRGIRKGDSALIIKDRVAHIAANDAVRAFLQGDCDTAFFVDSDCDIGPSYLEEMRSLEDEWQYDILQGFYVRRGWPPEAIWFKRTQLGDLMQCLVWKDDFTEDTSMAGLHNTLIRREVFEKMMEAQPDVPFEEFNWFYYPRHGWQSEDGVFCQDASKLGFRIGSTTKVKAGHISRVTTGWETYQEHLKISGIWDMWDRYYSLVEKVSDFLVLDYDTVIAHSIKGWTQTKKAFEKYQPKTADEYRDFYGAKDNGYLYDLLAWNTSPTYNRIIKPLKELHDKKVLVIGAGLGSEVEAMRKNNQVHVFELPGVLRDFLQFRFNRQKDVQIWDYETLAALLETYHRYDIIVAIDVVEHFHPDEFDETLDIMLELLNPDGSFYLHNNFGDREQAPMHFDHADRFDEWCNLNGIIQPEAPYGFYRRQHEIIRN